MSYTYIYPKCLARQGAPVGGKLTSQEIGGCLTCRMLEMVWAYRVGEVRLARPATAVVDDGNG